LPISVRPRQGPSLRPGLQRRATLLRRHVLCRKSCAGNRAVPHTPSTWPLLLIRTRPLRASAGLSAWPLRFDTCPSVRSTPSIARRRSPYTGSTPSITKLLSVVAFFPAFLLRLTPLFGNSIFTGHVSKRPQDPRPRAVTVLRAPSLTLPRPDRGGRLLAFSGWMPRGRVSASPRLTSMPLGESARSRPRRPIGHVRLRTTICYRQLGTGPASSVVHGGCQSSPT